MIEGKTVSNDDDDVDDNDNVFDDDNVVFDDEDRMPIALIKKLDRGRDSVAGGDGQQTLCGCQ